MICKCMLLVDICDTSQYTNFGPWSILLRGGRDQQDNYGEIQTFTRQKEIMLSLDEASILDQ